MTTVARGGGSLIGLPSLLILLGFRCRPGYRLDATPVYLAILGVFALCLGVIIRRTAGAIAAVLGIVLVLPVVVGALGSSFDAVSKFLPSTAGQAIFHSAAPGQHLTTLSPWSGFAVFVGYAIVTLAAGATLLARRDA